MRRCYPFLAPMQVIIGITTLYCFVAVAIGKKISQDHQEASDSSKPSNSFATEEFFRDPAHCGINIAVLVNLIITKCNSNCTCWWLTCPFSRMIFALMLASLAQVYGIKLFVGIIGQHGSCKDPYFDNTRTRCWLQYGVSSCEVLWSILLVIECVVSNRQRKDKKWLEQTAEEELRTSVVYNPDLSLETGHSQNHGSDNYARANIELTSIAGRQAVNNQTIVDEEGELPEYSRRRPRDQPRIVDAANPPQRLVGAVARLLQSDETGRVPSHALVGLSTPSPSPPPFLHTTQALPEGIVLDELREGQIRQPPPPSYEP